MKKTYISPKLNVETIKIGYVMQTGSPTPTVNQSSGDATAPAYSKDRDNNLEGSMGSLW